MQPNSWWSGADHVIWGRAESSSSASSVSGRSSTSDRSRRSRNWENVEFVAESESLHESERSGSGNGRYAWHHQRRHTASIASAMLNNNSPPQSVVHESDIPEVPEVDNSWGNGSSTQSNYLAGYGGGGVPWPEPHNIVDKPNVSRSSAANNPGVIANQGQEIEGPTGYAGSAVQYSQAEFEELHRLGNCKPCMFLSSRVGCLNEGSCPFCHLPGHNVKEKTRSRPCKSKRNQCKQIKNMLHTVFGPETPEFQAASERLSNESAYMRAILGHKESSPADVHERTGQAIASDTSPSQFQTSGSYSRQQGGYPSEHFQQKRELFDLALNTAEDFHRRTGQAIASNTSPSHLQMSGSYSRQQGGYPSEHFQQKKELFDLALNTAEDPVVSGSGTSSHLMNSSLRRSL